MIRRYQVRGRRAPIPRTTSQKAQTQPIDYKKGWFTGAPNDLQPEDTLRYVMDSRFDGIGKYKTRKGCDHYSVAIGEAVNDEVTATTGAADGEVSTTQYRAEKLTATATGPLTRVDIRLKNTTATGTIIIEVREDNSGDPGDIIARTSVPMADVTASYAYLTGYTIATPTITNTNDYWVVALLQESGTNSFNVSTTTASTNAKVSTDQGQTWTADTFSLNCKLYTADDGGVKGLFRATRPDGTEATFFAHGQDVYKVSDVDGTTTSVDSSIDSSSSVVRFEYVNDELFYSDGVGKPRKYDWSTSSEVTGAPYNTSNLMEHVGLMFYFDVDDPTRIFYSNFADYETFTSTDFIYVPAPKKWDHLKAMAPLNGILFLFTEENKHQLLGQDNATFNLGEANAQKGTFSQESVAYDENYIYFAGDDGIYRFNGTYEKNIAENIIDDYMAITDKESMHLQLHDNKLYVWYTPNGEAKQSRCFVYNTLYGVWESQDSGAYIGKSFVKHAGTDLFLQGSNSAGVVYYGEQSTNDYNNLGDIFETEWRTAYDHFGSPQQEKYISYWRPIIDRTAGAYSLQAGHSKDYSSTANFTDVPLQATGPTYGAATSLYGTSTYGAVGLPIDTTLTIFGEGYRVQRRYKHHAAREPVSFSGEVLKIQKRRLR